MHSSTSRLPDRPAPYVENAFFFLLYGIGFFVKDQESIGVWVYFWVFSSILFCTNTKGLLSLLFYNPAWEIPPRISFIVENGLHILGFGYSIRTCSFHDCEEFCYNFDGDWLESIDCFGNQFRGFSENWQWFYMKTLVFHAWTYTQKMLFDITRAHAPLCS